MQSVARIAVWSGPRNISTALMRAWSSRRDTVVLDEPLYGCYLKATGIDHPGAAEIMAAEPTDWPSALRRMFAALPPGRSIHYHKQMAHHLLPGQDRQWILRLCNALLIRNPAEMLASLSRVLPRPTLEQTGLPQQVELLHMLRKQTGETPPVIDARDVLEHPHGMLTALCQSLGVAFDEAMLSWPTGPQPTDGIWGQHWYENLWRSTGFEPYRPKPIDLPDELRPLLTECERLYAELYAQRLTRD